MKTLATLPIASLLLCACAQTPADDPAAAPSNSAEDWTTALEHVAYDPAKDDAPPAPPLPERDLQDMVAGCQGMNPQQRPRGSNCFGIFPEQCGADKAAQHVGETMSAGLVRQMRDYAVGRLRVIRPEQAVNDDLRYSRLNVHLDADDRIKSVDCY